jgi:hypothetical protein
MTLLNERVEKRRSMVTSDDLTKKLLIVEGSILLPHSLACNAPQHQTHRHNPHKTQAQPLYNDFRFIN